jgi:preprotein translocase subunit SecF
MREREPAMKALAKRVNARGGSPVLASTGASVSDASNEKRGPRNQPKRKGRK